MGPAAEVHHCEGDSQYYEIGDEAQMSIPRTSAQIVT